MLHADGLWGALAAAVAVGLVLAMAEWLLPRPAGLWVWLAAGALAMLAGVAAWAATRAARGASRAAASSDKAQADHMMGLALQGQGQLDKAYERLRKVPPSDTLMDNLYHLAQDFERQRNLARAKAIYKHILQYNRNHKDARARYRQVRALLQQPKEGSAPSGPHESPTAALPRLGRYHIVKEIGKGAMGVVYLGRDPTIGRAVAIKTLALSEEFEGDALIDARARFFREAETAGRLQHPCIVTIFDAGEENGLAYIAMEFLQGADLAPACRAGHLLPVATVLSIAARVADALDYAHAHNVVHRDIKPANIMFDGATDAVKVTDFGIARITDSSRTRTGLVLGTPSFMSPEQLAGKKVDGRSDLYSLGVTLFHLLTGSLPFRGETLTQLMHKIASLEAPDIRALRPELSPAVARIVAQALQKRPEARHQTGRQLAAELRQAGATDAGPQPRAVDYDAQGDATGHEMVDFQQTVMEPNKASSPPVPGAR
ncbi:protein kinase domain-containing protein [Acidovorax sp.]|uniref:serine/threonine-protein kinase n=1 Tax=Acidovorax sp. TaxID=1872122 RepID=UPI0039E27663